MKPYLGDIDDLPALMAYLRDVDTLIIELDAFLDAL